ncbi:MAG: methylmalonyl-CoA mutase subunit beta, partial [Bacteroidia bacterium]|nr:methylmalonyl-CoA mutase subunit beta [Bacteroidia bacterium]
MKTTLFDEFEPVSSKQWKQKIQYDLKGADYNESLVWQSLEGIHVKPFYHRDEFQKTFEPIPGQPVKWNIIQQVFIDDATIANRLAIDAIDRGADAICFSANSTFEITDVFLDFPFDNVTLYFQLNFLSESFLNELLSYLRSKSANFFLNLDLLDNLARTGNWFHNLKKDHEILESISIKHSEVPILSINTGLYQNAGANCVQQLAYGLAQANEYLNHFYNSERLGDQLTNTSPLTFHVAVGTNYFFEIAKIRALRKLYAVLAQEYGLKPECHIVATPSKRNKTLYDYNVNMLRTTTECMSAILGGANAVSNLPYDSLYHKSNEFGERISRNQLLILKSESYFDLVSNSSDGSYYIESLTGQL